MAKGSRPTSRGFSTLEKCLIFLCVLFTGVCVALVAVYAVENEKSSSGNESAAESQCGSLQPLDGPSGQFASGNYPGSYGSGVSCSWRITVDPDKVIHLWFEDFALENSILCQSDSVSVKDDLGIIGKFCGYFKPKPIVSLGNTLTVYFDTNERGTDMGFIARYSAMSPDRTVEIAGAGGHLQGSQGDLQTPGFPEKNYEDGVTYQWRITVPARARIWLTFSEFDLVPEACGDFVEVYDGPSILGRFCGGSAPGTMASNSNTLTVRFKTDSSFNARGFRAAYGTAPPDAGTTTARTSATRTASTTGTTTTKPTVTSDNPRTTATTQPDESGCGTSSLQQGRKGAISSKGFPAPYPSDLQCVWNITAPEGLLVKLEVTDMAVVGEAGQCGPDRLLVSDELQSLGAHCGYVLPPLLISAGGRLHLSFQSDARLADRGFAASWEAVYPEDIGAIQGCGGFSRERTGIISSQNWPLNYAANSECLWMVEVPAGETITLTFTHFEVEEAGVLLGRCFDHLQVYDGAATGAVRYGPFCGTKLPSTIQTTGNTLLLRFHADFFTEAKGFRAYWTTDATQPAPTDPPVPPNPWDDIKIDWPSTCGKPAIPPTVNTRIVNGEPANPNSWPWQVSMQVWPASQETPKFSHTCGGTLIHKNWVLTAAHCFIRYADELQRWRLCLGKHNLTMEEPSQKCFGVLAIHRHEGFRYPQVPTVEFDIALVRLDGEVVPSDEISYACLPPLEEVLPKDKKCYATGWGDETGNSTAPKAAETLNQVALPVVPYDTCKRMDYWWFQVKPSMICCGYTKPDELKSVCQGDSGGPLVCQDAPEEPWAIHGITSFGPIGCIMDKKPSVFTRASAYIPWIENIVRKDMFDLTTSGCGDIKNVTDTEGKLSSMGYPAAYSNDARCQWNILAPEGKLVHLHFEAFSLEDSQLCLSDSVALSDQIGSLGTHCNNGIPADLVSTGEILNIRFSSNNRVVDTGFLATWKFVDPVDIPDLIKCGGHFSSEQEQITSPGWPTFDYPAQSVCTWSISVPPSKKIHIKFTDFNVQAVSLLGSCLDYVEVYEGQGTGLTKLGTFCGFMAPPMVTTTGNTALIRFVSDGAKQDKGFRGYWTTDLNVFPTLPAPPTNPWDDVILDWPASCGRPAVPPNTSVARVVNGVEAVPYSWPWQVSMQGRLFTFMPFQHACGGSLIHEEWVLTAAHCFMQLSKPNMWQLCLGKHYMNSSGEATEACYTVDRILTHPGFVYPQSNVVANDVALVHLAQRVNMTREISPVCLPEDDQVLVGGTHCFVTGWGDEKGSLFPVVSKQLNQAPLPVVPFETCSKPQYWWDSVRPSMICAGYESPDELKSACQGDSGGPLVYKAEGPDASWQIQGIVSFGARGCAKDKKPSVFTRVSAFTPWIRDQIKQFIYEQALPSRT